MASVSDFSSSLGATAGPGSSGSIKEHPAWVELSGAELQKNPLPVGAYRIRASDKIPGTCILECKYLDAGKEKMWAKCFKQLPEGIALVDQLTRKETGEKFKNVAELMQSAAQLLGYPYAQLAQLPKAELLAVTMTSVEAETLLKQSLSEQPKEVRPFLFHIDAQQIAFTQMNSDKSFIHKTFKFSKESNEWIEFDDKNQNTGRKYNSLEMIRISLSLNPNHSIKNLQPNLDENLELKKIRHERIDTLAHAAILVQESSKKTEALTPATSKEAPELTERITSKTKAVLHAPKELTPAGKLAWASYLDGHLSPEHLLEAIRDKDGSFATFKAWIMREALESELIPHKIIGKLDVLTTKVPEFNEIATQIRKARFSMQGMPGETRLQIGRELSVSDARKFGSSSFELHELSPRMQYRSVSQANKILQRLLNANDPNWQNWVDIIPVNSPIHIIVGKNVSESQLKILKERFGANFTVSAQSAQITKILKICPDALRAYTPDSFDNLNEVFAQCPNLTSVNLSNLVWTQDKLASIRWSDTLQTLTCPTFADMDPGAFFDTLPLNLVNILCSRSNIQDADLGHLSRLTHLQKLDINNSKNITGTGFANLPASLRVLRAFSCSLTDAAANNLNHLTNLQELVIDDNSQITGLGFVNLPEGLLRLSASGCSLADAAITNLHHLTLLQTLTIAMNQRITGATLGALSQTLIELNCFCCNLTDAALNNTTHLTNLQKLWLDMNNAITGQSFHLLPTSLRLLRCPNCTITDEATGKLAHLVNLQELCLSNNKSILGQKFHLLPSSLQVLLCDQCSLTDAAISALKRLTALQKLDIGQNEKITGKSFDALSVTLRELLCGKCALTDDTIEKFARLIALEKLDISHHKWAITGKSFSFLPASLRTLDCFGCGLSYDAKKYLAGRKELRGTGWNVATKPLIPQ